MELINLTPHPIVVWREGRDPITYAPSGAVARIDFVNVSVAEMNGIDIVHTRMRDGVTGLPDIQVGVGYLVSTLIRNARWDRLDLYSPGDLVRNTDGVVVGCRNLVANE